MVANGGAVVSVRKRKWITSKSEPQEAWIVDYTDQYGARHIKTFDRKKDADAHAAIVQVDIRAGVHTTSKATVAEAGKRWIESCKAHDLEASTVESYKQHLRDHIVPYLGAMKLSQLTVPVIRNFMDKLRADRRSPDMVKRVTGDLGSILADAQERGEVAQNVVRSLSKRKKRHDRGQNGSLKVGIDIPTPAEIKAIVAHLKGRWRPLLLAAIFAGLRASEIRGLRWQDVDLRRGELHVRQRADKFKAIG